MTSIPYPSAVAPASERRTLIVALVAALHLGVIYAILVGLQIVPAPPLPMGPINVHFLPSTPRGDPPPTTPIKLVTPAQATAVQPVIIIEDTGGNTDGGLKPIYPDGHTGPTTDVNVAASAFGDTHSIPPYPTLDRRLNHEGTTYLVISVDASGAIGDVSVEKSSGYDGLDQAAIAWVKAHWRYKPATHNGAAVPSTARAQVVFHLTRG